MAIDTSRLSREFSFILHSGVEVFPIKVKRRATGKIAFRVSPGGNTVEDSLEVEEVEMINKVLNHRYSVRCSSINGAIKGLYIVGGSSIREVKRYNAT